MSLRSARLSEVLSKEDVQGRREHIQEKSLDSLVVATLGLCGLGRAVWQIDSPASMPAGSSSSLVHVIATGTPGLKGNRLLIDFLPARSDFRSLPIGKSLESNRLSLESQRELASQNFITNCRFLMARLSVCPGSPRQLKSPYSEEDSRNHHARRGVYNSPE